ncbi:MAG TPA: hypothetical protein VKM94_21515 [Blastocatellia bacterium]|nr:hypothetical protein [Blastocatellia bacterium]
MSGSSVPPRRGSFIVCLLIVLLLTSTSAVNFNRASAQDFSPQTIQLIDLGSTTANVQVVGASEGDHLSGNGTDPFPRAHALAVGDLNHDGIPDLIIGAPDADLTPAASPARPNAGAVYVVFGTTSFSTPVVIDAKTDATKRPDISIFGASNNDQAGFAVAAGDVNGDGIDDLIFGAPGHAMTGAVYIFFGKDGLAGGTVDLATPNTSNVVVLGEAAGDAFGSALVVGNVLGGSGLDLLVGAPASQGPNLTGPSPSPRSNGGAAELVAGGSNLANPQATTKVVDLATPAGAPAARIFGKTDSRLGASVAIGDVNGGTGADLVVGAPNASRPDPSGAVADTGAAFVIFGGANLTPTPPATTRNFDINATGPNISIYGEEGGDHLGAALAVGDVNSDGSADIIVGAPDSGATGGSRPGAGEAFVIAGGSDLNPTGGATELRIDVALGVVDLTVIGSAAGDHLGSSITRGRVNTINNTDAIPDVLIGAPGALSKKGAVHILFGGSDFFRFPARDVALGQDDARIIGESPNDELGWAIATGDFDNNRGGDIAVGAPLAGPLVQSVARPAAGKAYILLAAAANVPPVNANPTVTVTAPNGNEVAPGGGVFHVTWDAADADGADTIDHFEIRLSLDSGAHFNTTITTTVSGSARSFDWNVPTGINSSTARIRITVEDTSGGTGQDDSNADFKIQDVGVLVVLTAPNGGESLHWDQVFPIAWTVGAGLEDQVRGFDLFYTTDNGATFTPITALNPTQPALGAMARTFNWTVPHLCVASVKVLVRATSITSAVSSDQSNANFSISEPAPNVDTTSISFSGKKKLNFRVLGNSTPLFKDGVTVEVSTDATGSTLVPGDSAVKEGGTKVQVHKAGGIKIGNFIPDGAVRFFRITNPTCGVVVLRLKRMGSSLVVDSL